MIITKNGIDVITLNEKDQDVVFSKHNPDKKVHLIKLLYSDPSEKLLDEILLKFPLTNRFIVDDNIKFYNWYFKTKTKKYYVENICGVGIFSFFKKNNKILLNFKNLYKEDLEYLLLPDVFTDILKNLEIIELTPKMFEIKKDILKN